MKKFIAYLISSVSLCSLLQIGCEQKFDLASLPNPTEVVTIGDTNYVEIFPPWGGFESPGAIIIGNDQLIYVTDYANNEIIMLNASGAILKRRAIPHPISIAQNYKLDLYVGAETIAPNGRDTIGAIYRIALVRLDTIYLSHYETRIDTLRGDTTIIPIYRDTSYYANHNLDTAHMKIVWQEPGRPQRRYPGIGILPGNDYLVARTGQDNSSFVDPDTRVLLFNNQDVLQTPLGDLVTRPSGGTAVTDIKNLTSILVLPSSKDFILTQVSDGVAYGAIWMVFQSTPDFEGWLPKFDPAKIEQRGIDFVRPYRFLHAIGSAYDRRRREVFILDSELDSVVKFNKNGQFKTESFGRYKIDTDQFPAFHHPRGIAFSNDCTLYIADTGNKVIRRFKISTQTQCN